MSNHRSHLWISAMCQVVSVYSLYRVKHSTALQGRYYPILKIRKPRLREFSKLPEVTHAVNWESRNQAQICQIPKIIFLPVYRPVLDSV